MTCDLIVGSGWPFGAEWLQPEERSQIIVIGTKKLEGPLDYEVSLFELFKRLILPSVHPSPAEGWKCSRLNSPHLLSNKVEDALGLSDQIDKRNNKIRKIPAGKYVLYAMVGIMASWK